LDLNLREDIDEDYVIEDFKLAVLKSLGFKKGSTYLTLCDIKNQIDTWTEDSRMMTV